MVIVPPEEELEGSVLGLGDLFADACRIELNSAIHRQFREAHEGHKPHAGTLTLLHLRSLSLTKSYVIYVCGVVEVSMYTAKSGRIEIHTLPISGNTSYPSKFLATRQ